MGRPRKPASGVGKRIESLVRKDEKLSEFAERIGAPSSTLGSYIRGEREPTLGFLERLHLETNVDLNWLVSGSVREAREDALAAARGDEGVSAVVLARGEFKAAYYPHRQSSREKLVDITPVLAQKLDMKEQYVRAIFHRIYCLQEDSGVQVNAETFYFALSMIHQVMLDKFHGEDATDEQLEAVLSEYVDKLVKQAGWFKTR